MQRSINIDNVSQMDKYGNQTTLPHIVISSRCGCSIPQLNEYKSDAHPSTTQSHRTVSLAGWLNASSVIQAMCKNQPQHQQQINQCPTDCSSPDVSCAFRRHANQKPQKASAVFIINCVQWAQSPTETHSPSCRPLIAKPNSNAGQTPTRILGLCIL